MSRPTRLTQIGLLVLTLALSAGARAVIVEYTVSGPNALGLGPSVYVYDYTVISEPGDSFPVAEVEIEFDPAVVGEVAGTFGSLLGGVAPVAPPGWGAITSAVSTSPIPIPGLLNVFALTPADEIPVGGSLTGFQVAFVWTGGSGGPGNQVFRAFGAPGVIGGPLITEGTTLQVPEPGLLGLLGLAMGLLAMQTRARR